MSCSVLGLCREEDRLQQPHLRTSIAINRRSAGKDHQCVHQSLATSSRPRIVPTPILPHRLTLADRPGPQKVAQPAYMTRTHLFKRLITVSRQSMKNWTPSKEVKGLHLLVRGKCWRLGRIVVSQLSSRPPTRNPAIQLITAGGRDSTTSVILQTGTLPWMAFKRDGRSSIGL
jgi:hypothetical protein